MLPFITDKNKRNCFCRLACKIKHEWSCLCLGYLWRVDKHVKTFWNGCTFITFHSDQQKNSQNSVDLYDIEKSLFFFSYCMGECARLLQTRIILSSAVEPHIYTVKNRYNVPVPHSRWKNGTSTSNISYQYLTLCEKYAWSQILFSIHAYSSHW